MNSVPKRIGWCVLLVVVMTAPSRADQLVLNGDFEDGGGSLAGWTVLDQTGGSGTFFLQSGTTSPVSNFPVAAPPGPTHTAMSDQTGPGSHVLYQDVTIPVGATAATLMFNPFINNTAGIFSTPSSLDFNVTPNQQARVDFLTTTADPFSVAPNDVLLNVFQTHPGDPMTSGYTPLTLDLASFLAGHGGETLRLRFAEADNQGNFQFGVDQVSLNVTTVPEPRSLALLGGGALLIGLGTLKRRRSIA